MQQIRKMTIVAATALMFVLGSCSSNTSRHTSTPATSAASGQNTASSNSKTAFVAKAKVVCDRSNASLGDAAKTAFGASKPDDAAWRKFMVSSALPIISERLDDIAALTAPPTDKETIGAIVGAGRSAVIQTRQHPDVLSPASRAPFDRFDSLATAYGLESCAVGG